MIFPVFLFHSEIIAYVEVHRTKGIVRLETGLAVVIGMDNDVGTSIPSHVVVDHTKAAYAIEIDIAEHEVKVILLVIGHIGRTALVGYGSLQTGGEEPLAGEHPVIGIATREVEVIVVHLIEHQSAVYHGYLLAQSFVDQPL